MIELQKQIYRLGQVYGYICKKHSCWSSITHDTQAARQPLQGVTVALFAATHAGAIKADDQYIVLRMSSVSAALADIECCSIDDQGIFTLGKMQINRDAKTLIDMTGMTQQQIADVLGVRRETVSVWKSSGKMPQTARYELEEIVLNKIRH